jgi:hypothetical protein
MILGSKDPPKYQPCSQTKTQHKSQPLHLSTFFWNQAILLRIEGCYFGGGFLEQKIIKSLKSFAFQQHQAT